MPIKKIILLICCLFVFFDHSNTGYAASIYPPRPAEKPYFYNDTGFTEMNTDIRVELLSTIRNTDIEFAAVFLKAIPKGMTPEKYAAGLFKEWDIGKSNNGRGVLLLFIKDTNTLKVEVGYALEDIYTDLFCSSIQPMAKSLYTEKSPSLIFNQILLDMELKLTEKSSFGNNNQINAPPPVLNKDLEWIYLSGGAGIVDRNYLKGKENRLKAIQEISVDKIKEFSADKDAAVVIERFLKAYQEGINYPFLDIFLEGSQIYRLNNILLPAAIKSQYQEFEKNLPYFITIKGDLAVAEFKGKRVPPLLLRRDPAGLWRVDYAKTVSLVGGFGQRVAIETYHSPWSFGVKDRFVHAYWFGNIPRLPAFPLNLKEKIGKLKENIAKDPNNPANYFKLADIYHWECLSDEEAIKFLEIGLKLEPDNVPYHLLAVLIYEKYLPGIDNAQRHLEAALKYRPDDRKIYEAYSVFLVFALNDFKKENDFLKRTAWLEKKYIGQDLYSRNTKELDEGHNWHDLLKGKNLFYKITRYFYLFGELPSFRVLYNWDDIKQTNYKINPVQEDRSLKLATDPDYSRLDPRKGWAIAVESLFQNFIGTNMIL